MDVTKEAFDRVTILGLDSDLDGVVDAPFDEDATYKAAINSYRGTGGGGHLTSGAGIAYDSLIDRIIGTTARDLRYYLIEAIKEQQQVTPEAFGNWSFIPEDLAAAGTALDYPILFPDSSESDGH